MRTLEQRLQYENLELLNSQQQVRTVISTWSHHVWQWLVMRLAITNEPRITQGVDANGQQYWSIYDPVTRHTLSLTSEAEVRMWIEQRYYEM